MLDVWKGKNMNLLLEFNKLLETYAALLNLITTLLTFGGLILIWKQLKASDSGTRANTMSILASQQQELWLETMRHPRFAKLMVTHFFRPEQDSDEQNRNDGDDNHISKHEQMLRQVI